MKGGENWETAWFGTMPEAKVAVMMWSPEFFQSKPCVRELVALIQQHKPIIPVMVTTMGDAMKGNEFLGEDVTSKKTANFIKTTIGQQNWLPPPDQGVFQTNFKINSLTLVQRVKEEIARVMADEKAKKAKGN